MSMIRVGGPKSIADSLDVQQQHALGSDRCTDD